MAKRSYFHELTSEMASHRVTEALSELSKGDLHSARKILLEICNADSAAFEAWKNLAIVTLRMGEVEEAISALDRASTCGSVDGAILLVAANMCLDQGNLERSLQVAEKVLSNDPLYAKACNHIGILKSDFGQFVEAEGAFLNATKANSTYVQAFGNLASARLKLGKYEEAKSAAQAAVAIDNNYALGYFALASANFQTGNFTAAVSLLERTLSIDPKRVEAAILLARIFRQQQAIDAAEQAVSGALQIAPNNIEAILLLADIRFVSGDFFGAKAAYEQVLGIAPQYLEALLRKQLLLPTVYASTEEIKYSREYFTKGLEGLFSRFEEFAKLPRPDALAKIQYTNFYLAYQGEDDCELQKRYGEFVEQVLSRSVNDLMTPIEPIAVVGRKIRIGFVSRFFYNSTVGNYFCSWLLDLPREEFEVFVYPLNNHDDFVTAEIRSRADAYASFEADIDAIANKIKADNLDLLIYPEVGMDSKTFLLASMRLAPIQIAGWGHPVTTGLRNMDYFLSCEEMEPQASTKYYSERLHLLPGLGTRYKLPVPAETLRARKRSDYQLPEDKTLYLVPQSLFKIHPDNDRILVSILSRNSEAVLVMFAGQSRKSLQIFINRITKVFQSHGLATQGRIRILPEVSHADYKRINELCDLMIDTLHWSGGNTSLDALGSGLPVLTLPGRFMRGRQSMAMLKILGLEELIVKDEQELIDLAVALGQNSLQRFELRRRIENSRHLLFDNTQPTIALKNFLKLVAGRPLSPKKNH